MLQIEIQRRKKATVGTVQRILWFGGDANHRAIASTGVAASHFRLDTIPKQILKCKVRGVTLNSLITSASIVYDSTAMQHESKYIKSNGNIIRLFDHVYVESNLRSSDGLDAQIINVSYTSSYPEYLTFDVQVQADAPLYDADVSIAYNTANFGTSPTLTCTKNSGLGIYDFSSGASSGTITMTLSPGSSYPTMDPSDASGSLGTFPVPNDFSSYATIATCSLKVVNCCFASVDYIATSSVSGDYADDDSYLQTDGTDYWYDIDDASYATTGVSGSFGNGGSGICPSGATPNITSISGPDPNAPLTVTAGTFSVLTINGNGFGCDRPTVLFENASLGGGANFIHTQPEDIQSWSDNQITTWVPSCQDLNDGQAAASGSIMVQNNTTGNMSSASSDALLIPYAVMNVRVSSTDTRPAYAALKNQNGSGGYTFTPDNLTIPSSPNNQPPITEAMMDWECETGIQFTMGPSANITGGANSSDHINSITYQTPDNGAASETHVGVGGIYQNSSGRLVGAILDIDIVFNAALTYDLTIFPSANDVGRNTSGNESLLGCARHEFGHAGALRDVLNSWDLMFWMDPSVGADPPAIEGDDQNGGEYVLTYIGPNEVTGFTYSPQSFPSGCPTFTSNGIISLPDNSVSLAIYPNPFNDLMTISIESQEQRDVRFAIFDILGQKVLTGDLGLQSGKTDKTINTSSLDAGIYIVQVSIGSYNAQVKIIKNRN